ncbi:MAG: chromate transporter [Oscillospiraceae bacterium]|nr:chromate transporter [Oscillospiraceae bacterium]
MIYLTLFWEFAKVGIFCVGGGYASMPLIQACVVDAYHWLTLAEFIDIFTISQMTPGPIGINAATFAGMKVAGLGGSVAATLGFVAPSLILGIMMAHLFLRYGTIGVIRGALNGLRPAVVALICAAGVSFILLALWNTEKPPADWSAFDRKSLLILVLSLLAVRKKVGVLRVLLGSGLLSLLLSFL